MTNPQDPQENVPRYGTPEYAEWYATRFPEHQHAAPRVGQPGTPRNWTPGQGPKKSHRARNWIIGVVAVIAVGAIIGGATSSGDKPTEQPVAAATDPTTAASQTASGTTDSPSPTAAPTTKPAPPVKKATRTTTPPRVHTTHPPAPATTHKPDPKPTLTVSQQNAIGAARDYLQIEGFSRLGLIGQLSSSAGDGYSLADATFAVDYLHTDWNAQAVRSAKSYLSIEHFSRAGLIDQLSSSAGDQYTVAEATYAADHVGL